MAVDYNNPGKQALERWKLVAEEYLHNGYNQTRAYLKIYPECNAGSARATASRIFKSPPIKEYIQERRQEMYDALCLDSQHLATEIATIAFEHDTEQVAVRDRLKALDILFKAAREDEQAQDNKNSMEVIVRVAENVNNTD